MHGGVHVVQVTLLVGRFRLRLIDDFDRIHSPRDFNDRRIVEVAREHLRVNRGRGDDELKIAAAREQAFEMAKQEINVQAALVGFINDDHVVVGKLRIALRLGEQDAVGHQFDVGLGTGAIVETNLAADFASPGDGQFLGDAARDGQRGDATGLRATDLGADAESGFETHLGQLRGFA